MARPLITVIGSLNIDLITRVDRVPEAGETLLTQSYDTGCGGKGANQAVACARLSRHDVNEAGFVDVEMIGAVGQDAFGKELVESLKQNGIDSSRVDEVQGKKTGVAVIVVEEKTGDNRILMSPNANFCLCPEDFTDFGSTSERSRKPALVVLQLEIPLPTIYAILEASRSNGIQVLLNPAPAQRLPPSLYEAVTHLVVNETEAAIITDTAYAQNGEGITKATLTALVGLGVPNIVVTLGAKGVLYVDTKEGYVFEAAAEKVKVKDTTAAGDTFVGAYATAAVRYQNPDHSLESAAAAVTWANRAAALTVQKEGAQKAIPWLGEVIPYGTIGTCTKSSIEEWLRHN